MRTRIVRKADKILSAKNVTLAFYTVKPQITVKRKTVYDLFKN